MKNLLLKDKDLNIIQNTNLSLSILITQDGLSYSLYNVEDNKFVALVSKNFTDKENYLIEIENFLTDERIDSNYHDVRIDIADNEVTIVPNAMFNESQIEDLYKLNFLPNNEKKVLYSNLPKSSNVVLYSVKKDLKKYLDSYFSDYKISPQAFSFVESNYTRNKKSEEAVIPKLFIQVFENFFEVLVLKDTEVFFYNTFKYKSSNDLLYYIVNVFEQLKLSQEETTISVSGFIDTDDIAILNLRKFIKIVYFESQNIEYKYYYKFQETLPHYFVNFLNRN